MADLIIKPATGDGNKLILQDKDGDAELSTADTGASLTNINALTATTATVSNLTVTTGITQPVIVSEVMQLIHLVLILFMPLLVMECFRFKVAQRSVIFLW